VNIGDGSTIEVINRFRYLGDILSVDGSADAAVMVGVQLSFLTKFPPFYIK